MTFLKPVLKRETVLYPPASEQELDTGVEWARVQYEKDVDRDMLRVMVNTANDRRGSHSRVSLSDIVTEVVHEAIPLSDKLRAHKRPAYKGAVMKIYATRSARVSKRAASRRKVSGTRAERRSPKMKFTEDARPKFKGQLKFF